MYRKTFFSTDVIKYQNGDPNGTFSRTALWRWIEVTVPLTVFTLIAGWLWFRKINGQTQLEVNYQTQLDSLKWYNNDGPQPDPPPTTIWHRMVEKT